MVERVQYDPYGKPTFCDASWTPRASNTSAYANEILFGGYRWNPEKGDYDVRHRPYLPGMGTWGTWDPAGYTDSRNHYGYGNGNPATELDPTGMAFIILSGNGKMAVELKQLYKWKEKTYADPESRHGWSDIVWTDQSIDFEIGYETTHRVTIDVAGAKGPRELPGGPFPAGKGTVLDFSYKTQSYELPLDFRVGYNVQSKEGLHYYDGKTCRKKVYLRQNCLTGRLGPSIWATILSGTMTKQNEDIYAPVYLYGRIKVSTDNVIPSVAECDCKEAETSLERKIAEFNKSGLPFGQQGLETGGDPYLSSEALLDEKPSDDVKDYVKAEQDKLILHLPKQYMVDK